MGNYASGPRFESRISMGDAASVSANQKSVSAASTATQATPYPDPSDSDHSLFEAVVKEVEHAIDYGHVRSTVDFDAIEQALIPPEKTKLFRQWNVARSDARRPLDRNPEVAIRRIRDTDFHDVASRGALLRHLASADMAFVEIIPLGRYGDQMFGVAVTGQPANWTTEPDPLPLPISPDVNWAPHAYIWVRARPVEAMIQQPPDGFPQRKYGYCAGMPLDDERDTAAHVVDAADTPHAHVLPTEATLKNQNGDDGNGDDNIGGDDDSCISVDPDEDAGYAANNKSMSMSRATTSQLPRLHVSRTRPSAIIQELPAEDAHASMPLSSRSLSARHHFVPTSCSPPGRKTSAVSSQHSSDANSRQSSSSQASSRLSLVFDTASNGLSEISPEDSCDGYSPVVFIVETTRRSSLSRRTPLTRYLDYPFFYLGAVYAKRHDDNLAKTVDNVPWARMHHVVVVSMLDASVWLLYDAWERGTDYDDEPPEEWDDDGDPDNPLPDHHRFRPDYDPHWGRLGSDTQKPRRVMAQIARSVRDWPALGCAHAPLELGACVFPPRHFPVLVVTCLGPDGSILPPAAVRFGSKP